MIFVFHETGSNNAQEIDVNLDGIIPSDSVNTITCGLLAKQIAKASAALLGKPVRYYPKSDPSKANIATN